jgi:diguanylate cyclase (GGDEF)-like protein
VSFVTGGATGPVLSRLLKTRNLILLAVAYLGVQALCILVFPAHAMGVSYPFIILAPWLTLAVCWTGARAHAERTRLLWTLVCAALALWGIGILFAAWEDLAQHTTMTVAGFSDFLFFVYGMPVMLAIASPTEGERIPLFVWLDALQALMTAFLTYVTIFSVIPFTHQAGRPLSVPLLLITYNVENVALAVAATLRLLAYTNDGEERRFYQVLCGFLWAYTLCTGLFNHVSVATNGQTTLYDLLGVFPFLLLACCAVSLFVRRKEAVQSFRRRPLTLFIDNASPIFFTIALLALGAALVRQHFYVGMTGIVVAVAAYGIRATLLQSRYMHAQHDLQEARDKMEEMSLTDSLTGAANRRSFDHTLAMEWRRAVRRESHLSLLMIDVDYFKNLNDKYGHPYGDECLIQISNALQSALPRSADLLARYGGEEFAVILPATDEEGANKVAQRMLESVRALRMKNETPIGEFVTISVGITTYEFPHEGSPGSFVQTADGALYLAKRRGRNRLECASGSTLTTSGSLEMRGPFEIIG